MEQECLFCKLKPGEEYIAAEGVYTSLYAGKTKDNTMIMFAAGEDYSEFFYPRYCPVCGKSLVKDK